MYYVSLLENNLMSVGCLIKSGFSVLFNETGCLIQKEGKVYAKAQLSGGLYILQNELDSAALCNKKVQAKYAEQNKPVHDTCVHFWHRRLGHAHYKNIEKMPELSEGCKIKRCNKFLDCNVCKRAKSHCGPYPQSDRVSEKPFELVHADLCGPFPGSNGGQDMC